MTTRDRYYIGEAYGGSQARRSTSDMVEWEWVHTGRAFARSHPKGRFGGGLYLVGLFVFCHGLGNLYFVVMGGNILLFIIIILDFLSLLALLRRWPAAWILVWGILIMSFPVSLPLMIYWADGMRPNLIYRLRFERLVRPKPESPDV